MINRIVSNLGSRGFKPDPRFLLHTVGGGQGFLSSLDTSITKIP